MIAIKKENRNHGITQLLAVLALFNEIAAGLQIEFADEMVAKISCYTKYTYRTAV